VPKVFTWQFLLSQGISCVRTKLGLDLTNTAGEKATSQFEFDTWRG
jgi:hypothetical protein